VGRALGVDARGRPPLWTVELADEEVIRVAKEPSLEAALASRPDAEVVAVDVPIGHEHPDGRGPGQRACDRAARELLGAARERLYQLPPPVVFEADSYHEALARCRREGWPELQAPFWFARERLATLARAAGEDERVHEVHPEVSFAAMGEADGEVGPAEGYGESWAALHARLERLHGVGVRPEGHLEEVDDRRPRSVLDATAAAWSGVRVARGQARRLPAEPPTDPRTGREVAIHA
jgi:predicted RNase H-like nuclease